MADADSHFGHRLADRLNAIWTKQLQYSKCLALCCVCCLWACVMADSSFHQQARIVISAIPSICVNHALCRPGVQSPARGHVHLDNTFNCVCWSLGTRTGNAVQEICRFVPNHSGSFSFNQGILVIPFHSFAHNTGNNDNTGRRGREKSTVEALELGPVSWQAGRLRARWRRTPRSAPGSRTCPPSPVARTRQPTGTGASSLSTPIGFDIPEAQALTSLLVDSEA